MANAVDPRFLTVRSRELDFQATHGMLIVGGRSRGTRVLISHLPMLHAPHDRQAIFEGILDRAASDDYLNPVLNPRNTFYTIDPGNFVLPTFLAPLAQARPQTRSAILFTGIFDRRVEPQRGIPLPDFRTGAVRQVTFERLLYGDLIPSARNVATGTPYVITQTRDGEIFLIHRVTRSSQEYDQFVKLSRLDARGMLAALLRSQSFVLVNAIDIQDSHRGARATANNARLRLSIEGTQANGQVVEVAASEEAYFFVEDLLGP